MMFPRLYGHALARVHGSLREWIFLESGALAFYLTKMARCFAFSDSDLEEQHHHYSPRTGAHLLHCSGSEGSCPLAAAVLSLGWDGGEGLWGHSPARSLQQPQEEAAGRWGHRQTEPSGPCIALSVRRAGCGAEPVPRSRSHGLRGSRCAEHTSLQRPQCCLVPPLALPGLAAFGCNAVSGEEFLELLNSSPPFSPSLPWFKSSALPDPQRAAEPSSCSHWNCSADSCNLLSYGKRAMHGWRRSGT